MSTDFSAATDLVAIGRRFKRALDAVGATQSSVASEAGRSRSFVSKICKGQQLPSIELLDVLARRHSISATWIISELGPLRLPQATEAQVHALVPMTAPGAGGEQATTPPQPARNHELVSLVEDLILTADESAIARARGYLEGIREAGGAAPPHAEHVKRRA